ncbi:unnamed protein product [Cuscuta campestris]|uniref:CCHC-type domain-containing protein n=1 Tax=Cuscuta campestris TaxID=132261 RepID=A0A484NDQ6_9ASTE|nr:unnamed protein product [Cuscuta campestris]VFQ98399.1 unnamed protein product [Cuscuta campestris]
MKKVEDKLIPKSEDEFDAEDIKKVENYAKAVNMLYCVVNPDDYRKISCYSTAKEMWDKLEVTYEGTDQVREAKIDFLTQEDLVRKILRSLTSEWRSKVDAIYESIGTSNVTIEGLRGNLKTYESTILNPSLNDQRKGIALKASKEPTMNDSSDDDEVKLVMKKFCKLLRKKEKVEDGPVCHGCGEVGHIKNKCPRNGRNTRNFKKQRAYISWGSDSGDESTDQDEDETANLCLIAHEDQTDNEQEASKKKGPTEATTSAPQPFPYLDGSFLEFGSEEELTRFLNHFAKRPISPPRVVPELYPQQKGYHDLDNQLQASGLWSFVSRSRQSYNPAFVRAFYSNLRRDGDTIRSSINLYDVEIDLPTFARITGLPIRGDDIATYGGDDWILNNEAIFIREFGITSEPTIHSAPPDKRLLLFIITRILRPQDSSHTSLFNKDLKAIHAIIHGASINWAKFVMIHMADCASLATERSLPYAFLIMDIIVSADIHIVGPDTKMTKSIERMDWTLQCQHHDMMAYFRGINYVPPPFDSTILSQNFEGEDEDDDSYAPSSSPDEADFEDAVDSDPMDVEDDDEDADTDS